MGLSKEQILAASSAKTVEEVQVPEWGGSVYVRILKGSDRDSLVAMRTAQGEHAFFVGLIAVTVCDESGISLGFTPEDIPGLADKGLTPLTRIFNAAAKLNGLTATAVETAKGNS